MRYHIRLIGVILTAISLLALCSVAYSATIYVSPGGNDASDGSSWALAKLTIAGGISAAQSGDEVWVAAGTYTERITLKSGISLYGGFAGTETDRESRSWTENPTIIDASTLAASDSGSTVTIATTASANTRIDGFVIRGGTGTLVDAYTFGGGIYCPDNASPTIANNTISDNTATNGAGIYCYNCTPVITGNKIKNNTAEDWGGGIYCRYCESAEISNNTVEYNHAAWGSGIACFHATVDVTGNRVWYNSGNTTGSSGGGIYCEYLSSSAVSGNIVVANTADYGGGVNLSNFTGTFTYNRVTGNSANYGAGVNVITVVGDTTALIASNVINSNAASVAGGGIYCQQYSSPQILNNTIVNNSGKESGGGIGMHDAAPKIANNIVAYNTTGIYLVRSDGYSGPKPTVMNNCVYKNRDGDYSSVAKGTGDKLVDPKLVSIGYGDYHLQPDSPCINGGALTGFTLTEYDFDGGARKTGTSVDIGAFEADLTNTSTLQEAPAVVIYVSPTGDDDNDGLSWDTAKLTIQAAVDEVTKYGGDIWVAAGDYDEHITMRPYVHMFGGFAGTETDRTERDYVNNLSTIYPQSPGRIITISRALNVNTIDGFVLTGSDASAEEVPDGGAIYCEGASPLIANNTITSCSAANGGAISCEDHSNPTISSNTISACSATHAGGAIYCVGQSSPLIRNNILSSNIAEVAGGAILLTEECSSVVKNNVIEDNQVGNGNGGGISCSANEKKTSPTIANNVILRNVVTKNGGGIYVYSSNPTIANNIVAHNLTGGIFGTNNAVPVLSSNCLFENTTYNYSGISKGTGDIDADPQFVDAAGDYHLISTSPCIDAGNDSIVRDGDLDLDNGNRIYGYSVDIGVDEWRGIINQSLTPNSGNIVPGRQVTLTSVCSHPAGYENIQSSYLMLNPAFNDGETGVMVRYNEQSNLIYMKNDAGTGWIGGYAPGSSNVIQNSRAKIYCAATTVNGAGDTLTINWRIETTSAMAGKVCSAYMLVTDTDGLRAGWDTMGSFTISYTPVNVSVTPSSGGLPVETRLSITSKYSDLDGYSNITNVYLLINTTRSTSNAAYVRYDTTTNKLYVRKDDDSGWLGGYAPGTAYGIENSHIKLYCSTTTVSGSGSTRTITWNVKVKSPFTENDCGVWMKAEDKTGLVELGTEANDGWKKVGALSLSQAPVNVSLSPATGTIISGNSTRFTAQYSDADGYADIASCYLLMNTTLTEAKGIFVRYDVAQNKLYLRTSTTGVWIGGYAPGSNNSIENIGCILDCSQTVVSRSGNTVTVYWKIKVKSGMIGKSLSAWMLVTDESGLRDNYEKMGAFKVGKPI